MDTRRTIIIGWLVVLVLSVAACQTPPVQLAATPTLPTRLNLAIGSEPPTLDPHRTSDSSAAEVFGHVCETLVYQDLDLTNRPLLAETWEFAPDGKSATFKLRQGITFHDGTALDAAAVKSTFERLQQAASVESPIYEDMKDVQIETPDNQTVVFKFEVPRWDFLDTLRNTYAIILSPAADKAGEGQFGRKPVCTGPYQVKEWQPSQFVLLAQNPAYAWPPDYYTNRGPAKIDEIKISFVDEHATRYLALLNGELDLLSLSAPEEVAEIKSKADVFGLYEGWSGGISFLGFNYQRPPTNEPSVRKALAHAIDKQAIVSTVLPGMASPAFAPLAPSTFGFLADLAGFEYKYDPKQSEQLLAEAGFADSNNDGIVERDGQPLKLDLLTTDSSTYGKIFTLLQDQLKAVGVDVEMRQVPMAEISKITPTGDFDLLLYHYNWPFPSALALFLGSKRVGASNRVAYSNSQVDDLLAQAAAQPGDSPEKLKLLVEAQQTILKDAPWQPLFVRKLVTAINNRVQGMRVHPAGGLLLHDAVIADQAQKR